MKTEMRMILVVLAAAGPIRLSAQRPEMTRTLSADSILVRLERGAATTGGAPGAGGHATAYLCQSADIHLRTGRVESRSRAELDAFADRLVDIAVANPGTDVASGIRVALRIAGNPGFHPGESCIRYDGAWDALRTVYEGGAGELQDLLHTDIQRGVEFGLARLADMEGTSLCRFVGNMVQFGHLSLLGSGTLEFEAFADADYNSDTPPLQPDWMARKVALAEELLAEGFVRDTGFPWSPCATGLVGIVTVDGEERPSPTEIKKNYRGFYVVDGDTVRVLKRRGKGGESPVPGDDHR